MKSEDRIKKLNKIHIYYQAEILVKNHIPLSMIKNNGDFGISILSQPQKLQIKNQYTALDVG